MSTERTVNLSEADGIVVVPEGCTVAFEHQPFTIEQEARIREIVRSALSIAVAASSRGGRSAGAMK
jgi:hypothetical protein